MDEPTHLQESIFWDRVAEWLLDAEAGELGPESIAQLTIQLPGQKAVAQPDSRPAPPPPQQYFWRRFLGRR